MALDIGDKRIGIAVTDPFNSYALPSETYRRTGNFFADVEAMAQAARSRGVGCIEKLREAAGMPVFTEDERFTSLAAHDTLHEEGLKAAKHKKSVDAVAAAYILEGFLARRNRPQNQ